MAPGTGPPTVGFGWIPDGACGVGFGGLRDGSRGWGLGGSGTGPVGGVWGDRGRGLLTTSLRDSTSSTLLSSWQQASRSSCRSRWYLSWSVIMGSRSSLQSAGTGVRVSRATRCPGSAGACSQHVDGSQGRPTYTLPNNETSGDRKRKNRFYCHVTDSFTQAGRCVDAHGGSVRPQSITDTRGTLTHTALSRFQ